MAKIEALVTPEMLRWARERAGLGPEAAAEKVKVRPHKILAWESGQSRPSFRQATLLANALKVPIGYLYLDLPPDERSTLPDLRTLADAPLQQFGPDLQDVLNDALRKQDWYRDYLLAEGASELKFIGSFTAEDPARSVAEEMRSRLGMGLSLSKGSKGWDAYLTSLVRRAEEVGVTVLRSGIVGSNTHRPLSVSEFRGFALVDAIAPVVFINSRDTAAARIFTLVHELAHLWIGHGGISNQDPEYVEPSKRTVEMRCNAIAAEALVPSSDLLEAWTPGEAPSVQIDSLAREFRVSQMVVLRRAYNLSRVTPVEFKRLAKVYAQNRGRPGGAGGNFYRNLAARSGEHLMTAVVASALEGRTLYREAARLLSVSVPTLRATAVRLGFE